jgi:hypothetical protein
MARKDHRHPAFPDRCDLVPMPGEDEHRIEVRGDLAGILAVATNAKGRPERDGLLSQFDLVAGRRNPLYRTVIRAVAGRRNPLYRALRSGFSTTIAFTASPHFASGTPTTAASAMAGWAQRTSSTSLG